MKHDRVDRIISAWHAERPDLAVAPLAVIGRLGRLMAHIDRSLEAVFAQHGISRAAWDVIATLRRAGAPYRMTQRQLLAALMRTPGTMSVRIDRLEEQGFVRREPSREDRRTVHIRLTPKAMQLFDRVAPLHLANEERLLAALSKSERSALAALLRKLLLSFETDGDLT